MLTLYPINNALLNKNIYSDYNETAGLLMNQQAGCKFIDVR